ncbi:MAG: tRNA pseudouridine(38-40) synthase TruA [Desulfotignum sp.]|nr:tRNA pseudouridine(38-40) synthase TruA [Desulfotignum sp.]MCF8113448.1 tRNA pseudouridine(38-40) synthase TruA [Desulfotignum sp.]MCF8125990.1 tRNA pseudouridine(38-40) synthase TruA [Desulfotignum sp.]
MSQTFKLTIEYDGTGFSGWQRQADKPTIQGELEKVLSRILSQPVYLAGSGRTDAGVHAWGQVASFCADTAMDPLVLQKGANSLMKHPVVIQECCCVPDDFHARYSAVSKEYNYFILNREHPCAVGRNYVWHINMSLDADTMNRCCALLCGTHDFKSFENTGSPRRSTVRSVFAAQVEKQPDNYLKFRICADGFLKNMVRNIVGTLVDVGRHKITRKDFEKILSAKNRSLAGATAPARGLFLKQVNYDQKDLSY